MILTTQKAKDLDENGLICPLCGINKMRVKECDANTVVNRFPKYSKTKYETFVYDCTCSGVKLEFNMYTCYDEQGNVTHVEVI